MWCVVSLFPNCTTGKNNQRYYTPKRLIRYVYPKKAKEIKITSHNFKLWKKQNKQPQNNRVKISKSSYN